MCFSFPGQKACLPGNVIAVPLCLLARDLMSWINGIRGLVSSDELARDVTGAEALLERHQVGGSARQVVVGVSCFWARKTVPPPRPPAANSTLAASLWLTGARHLVPVT